MKKLLLTMMSLLLALQVFSQTETIVKGHVEDPDGPVVGANVVIEGTSSGTITDIDGNFSFKSKVEGSQNLVISFVGYQPTVLDVNLTGGTFETGTITLESETLGLSEVEVIASVAIDRKTPIAVSSIGATFIEEKAGNQEFPELVKSTPGVYATKQGGGYGDSRITVRGFNDVNVAVLINGVPVNDMENGRVYWSNWAGLTDVTRSMQVQRGLGASKVAVPSIGGTINIVTKSTDAKKGGYIYTGIGNNNWQKLGFSYSTGLTENNWAFTFQGARIKGDGWADGLQFEGYNYFFNVSKILNEKHTISLTGFGAPQRHGQRQNYQSIETYQNAPQGTKYNADWGYLNGQIVNVEDNFYHKPQFSLNHYWTISRKSELSTAVYVSTGTGGGGGTATEEDAVSGFEPTFGSYRTGGAYSAYDLDQLVALNQTSTDGRALAYLRASRNDHRWYGVLSTYKTELSDKLDFLAGLDLRRYKGIHFSEVTDLLGADYAYDNADINNPGRMLKVGDKRDYYNDGIVLWEGGFLQAEYNDGPLAAFVTVSASNTSYKRIDYYNYLDSDPEQETEFQNFFGYQIKGGVNYNLNEYHNVFANVGYFEKAPDFDAVFQNYVNDINPDAVNQKILSYEVGYGFRSAQFSANVNVYRTSWKDRTFTDSFYGDNDDLYFANLLGVDALHQGIEVDFEHRPTHNIKLTGMVSLGDWKWQNNVSGVNVFDEQQNIVGTLSTLYITGLRVGDAAQTTAALGFEYSPVSSLKLGANYNYYGDNYADYDPINQTNSEIHQAWKIPDFGLFDVNARFDFKLGNLDGSFYANVNNLFNEEYISDAQNGDSNDDGIADSQGVSVYYGLGRQWTAGLKIKF
ncbi:MAG: TonB-dependent receptor [Thalassobius sp.]|nr:TonB-dependent receptor [Thalassovita sp.]